MPDAHSNNKSWIKYGIKGGLLEIPLRNAAPLISRISKLRVRVNAIAAGIYTNFRTSILRLRKVGRTLRCARRLDGKGPST